MRVSGISVSYGRTFNLGDGNFIKLSADMTAEVEEGDDALKVGEALSLMAKALVRHEALPVLGGFRRRMKEIVSTLSEEDQKKFEWMFEEPSLELIFGIEQKEEDKNAD